MRATLIAIVLLGAVLSAQAPSLPPLNDAFQRAIGSLKLEGAGLTVANADALLHRDLHGNVAADTEMPIASASKWLAVATILTLVDEGKLDLDLPVARYLPEFDRDDKRRLTLRQCLACTGGVAPRLQGSMRGMDMNKFAAAAAETGIREQAGSTFRYSGVSFQIAAVAAVRVSGKNWHELFGERIAAPLGMTRTRFGTLLPVGGEAGTAALPWVAGGAVSTLDDYTRFLRMLVGKGSYDGKRVLAEATVAAMFRDQVPQMVEVHPIGFEAEKVRYGLGTWIESLPAGGPRVSDPGAFGFTPWIDLDIGIGGVFAVRDRVGRVLANLRGLQDAVRTVGRSPSVAGTEEAISLRHDGRDRRYLLHVPPLTAQQGQLGMPLLVALHGGGGHAEQFRDGSGLVKACQRAGMAVAFVDGTGPLRGKLLTWNSGGIAVYAAEHDVDDVGFLRAVVHDVQRRIAIDPSRVFATGHSNGGMMCHRLAREAADVFAGIAVVSGAMNYTAKDSDSPIAVLLIHGTADEHVRYDGGTPRASIGRAGERTDASVQQAIDYYVERNELRGYPEHKQDGKVRVDDYAVSKTGRQVAPLRVITLDGGGHAWPGGERSRALTDAPFPFDAAAAIATFFAGYSPMPRPAAAPR